ncbi:MAG: VanW family protein [Fimbriimonadaceae bacterium]|nr:VanW family protein [Fimbriimonadaceae bacterium]QYK55509.1 MAG: VanW family protein [Fimbriimonadaceae bacterium]
MQQTMAKLPREDFWAMGRRVVFGEVPSPRRFAPVVAYRNGGLASLRSQIAAALPKPSPAKVSWDGKAVRTVPESVSYEVDDQSLKQRLMDAVFTGDSVQVPLRSAKPRVSNEDLAKIKEVVASYTTNYSEGNVNRASNIRVAASKIDGVILMPGESFSFNGHLGRRTEENGFKLAGVYVSGRHDFDIGGGICQVSTTLYNAVLYANLKVKTRFNHSLPVAYVPLGRDATVSYPAPDFAFENSFSTPIALSAQAGRGSITFRILGTKDPSVKVEIVTGGRSSWGNPVRYIEDSSLPPGKQVVQEPGGAGHRISSYRVVMRDGQEVARESLGTSTYGGGPRVIRINRSKPKADANANAVATAKPAAKPAATPTTPVGNPEYDPASGRAPGNGAGL